MHVVKTPVSLIGLSLSLVIFIAACGQSDGDNTSEKSNAPAPVATEAAALPESAEGMARAFLKELVEIDTTQSTGNTTVAAEAMARHLRTAGFDEEDIHILGPTPDRGNLVVRYRGRDNGRKALLLLAHIDVVEADPADWTMDPFTFVEEDGYFYGRGTTDDKDEAAIHIANLIHMKREGFQPDRDIVVALTADEESGDHNGVAWLLEHHPELIDAEYALNEGGGGAKKDGVRVFNGVQASEKVFQSYTLEVTNPGGHSSLPVKVNAIYQLADALIRIRDHDFPVSLNEITRAWLERSAPLEEGERATAMRNVLKSPPDPAAVEYLSKIPFYNSRLRTTCVATLLDGGHAENALPQRATANVNCRVLPGASIDEVKRTLERVIDSDEVLVTPVAVAKPSPPSPLSAEVLGPIEATTEAMWPGVPVIPLMSTGATDSLYLRNAGIPVYGVSGLFNDIDDNRAHGQNERINIEAYYEGQEFLYRLTKALTRSDVL
ncbi:M20/M25/M40 family metallo-hydrolase [Woeseia oceani]|uniref:M20/M25/M40 family metallo-hydrolase n=1 Tax=Woeseia oceani TaxID=1548547 RepID=UPI000B337E09|nr:M20/M25/M40 family metallo-hydrolase [Woeseia oceani]